MLETIFIVCLLALSSVFGDTVITKAPLNNATISGTSEYIEFECSMDLEDGDALQWIRHCADGPVTISVNEFVLEEFAGEYLIDGTYNLRVLWPTHLNASCMYECRNILLPPVSASAELVVLVADPVGWSSGEETNHIIVEGDFVNFTCSAQTVGSFKPRHVISHNQGGSMTQYDCSGGGQTGFSCWSVNEEIERGDESRVFSCETLFDPSDLPEFPDGHATNAPDFSHILPLPQIEEVQYPPDSAGLTPNGGQIAVGQSIVCFAESNPVPEFFQWYVDGDIHQFNDENSLLIEEIWSGRNIYVRCIAINENINGEPGSGSSANTEFQVL